MRIAVLNLTGGMASVGYKRYVAALLPRLAAAPEAEAVLCASPASLGLENWIAPSPKITFSACEPFRFLRHSPDAGLRAALDAFAPDLLFVPLERYVAYRGLPVVTVLHNMAPLAGAKTGCGLMAWVKSSAQAMEAKFAVSKSAAVIAPTAFVRDFLVSELGAPAGKVTAVNFGPSPLPAERRRPAGWASVEGAPAIFTAGSMERYRGVEDLIAALPSVKARFPGVKLYIGGGARPATLPHLEKLRAGARAAGLAEDVVWLGSLTDEEMAWCYGNCSVFVMTSRLESFGFPALEAMQYGCNCVSSAAPCLPEIFGGAAPYYQPGDAAALAARVCEVLARGAGDRALASSAALRRAAGFSWDSAAAKTLEVLEKAARAA